MDRKALVAFYEEMDRLAEEAAEKKRQRMYEVRGVWVSGSGVILSFLSLTR